MLVGKKSAHHVLQPVEHEIEQSAPAREHLMRVRCESAQREKARGKWVPFLQIKLDETTSSFGLNKIFNLWVSEVVDFNLDWCKAKCFDVYPFCFLTKFGNDVRNKDFPSLSPTPDHRCASGTR
jgi:hypothetical protein